MDDWQPIETAPKDKRIIGINNQSTIEIVIKYGNNWYIDQDGYCPPFKPIKWMLLPNPPKNA